jgi:1L-myo-inositol 1-phosphate cytidylyltransferase
VGLRDSDRTGVVLAAGLGSRLAGASEQTSLKPLTPVGGVPLFQRTVRGLKLAGCSEIVVVLGFEADAIRQSIEASPAPAVPLHFVVNDRYQLANGISVLTAQEHVGECFVLTMADHVFGDEVMTLAAAHAPPEDGASLLVDYKLASIFDLDDATKVLAQDGKLVRIGKQIEVFNCVDTGLFVCTRALFDALREVHNSRGDASLSEGVQRLAQSGRMSVVDIGDGFWQDIDTKEMLYHAERMLAQRAAATPTRSGPC